MTENTLTIGSIVRSTDTEGVTFVVMATFPDGTYGGELMYEGDVRVVVRQGFVYDESWAPIEEPCDCQYCEASWREVSADWAKRYPPSVLA